jgi:hypothetical protein
MEIPRVTSVRIITVNVDDHEAVRIVDAIGDNADVSVNGRVYYPYYSFTATCLVPNFFGKTKVKTRCLVDASHGAASTADRFETQPLEVEGADIVRIGITADKARRQAVRYVSHALGRESRSIADFDVQLTGPEMVFKKFWLVRCGAHRFIVDSVTGRLHGISRAA